MNSILSSVKRVALLAASWALLSSTASYAEKMRIVTEGAYPPFSKIDVSGAPVGFDVDIAVALCQEMKVDCEIVTQEWDGIIPGLMAQKYDAAVASMSISEERKKSVDFTRPYYSNKLQFIGPKSQPLDISTQGLRGKTIGAQRSTVASLWFEENRKGVDLRLYGNQEEALSDLSAGRLDAIIADIYVSYAWLRTREGSLFEFKGPVVYDDDKVAIAVRKGNSGLRERFNNALKRIRENGTYARINARYFPFDIY